MTIAGWFAAPPELRCGKLPAGMRQRSTKLEEVEKNWNCCKESRLIRVYVAEDWTLETTKGKHLTLDQIDAWLKRITRTKWFQMR